MNYLSNDRFFHKRVYLSSELSQDDLRLAVFQNDHECKGAGIAQYSNFLGQIMSILGFAVKIKLSGQTLYVNTDSFAKFAIRLSIVHVSQLANFPSRAETIAKQLDSLYAMQYERASVQSLHHILQKNHSSHEIISFKQLMDTMQMSLQEGKFPWHACQNTDC